MLPVDVNGRRRPQRSNARPHKTVPPSFVCAPLLVAVHPTCDLPTLVPGSLPACTRGCATHSVLQRHLEVLIGWLLRQLPDEHGRVARGRQEERQAQAQEAPCRRAGAFAGWHARATGARARTGSQPAWRGRQLHFDCRQRWQAHPPPSFNSTGGGRPSTFSRSVAISVTLGSSYRSSWYCSTDREPAGGLVASRPSEGNRFPRVPSSTLRKAPAARRGSHDLQPPPPGQVDFP